MQTEAFLELFDLFLLRLQWNLLSFTGIALLVL